MVQNCVVTGETYTYQIGKTQLKIFNVYHHFIIKTWYQFYFWYILKRIFVAFSWIFLSQIRNEISEYNALPLIANNKIGNPFILEFLRQYFTKVLYAT